MRISLIPLLGLGCTAALLMPASAAGAAPARPHQPTAQRTSAPRTTTLALTPLSAAAADADRAGEPDGGDDQGGADRTRGALTRGLDAPSTAGFALLGVSWDDPTATLRGTVEVRTRPASGGGRQAAWSAWRPLSADTEDSTGQGLEARRGPHARGATAPLWVGPSDGVQVRVHGAAELPQGLRVDLVDPGTRTAVPRAELPAEAASPQPADSHRLHAAAHTAPRPGIVTRSGWGADESLRESGYVYTGTVKVVFVHHTDTGNDYGCADSPSVIRSIYQYHVVTNGWRDIGYNFLVDRCGTIYEGRAGGVARSVLGAHTLGFNTDSSGVAALGTYTSDSPPQAQVDGITKIAAWKLGLGSRDAAGTATLTSASDGSRYPQGTSHTFYAISGHRDAFATDCPGDTLYARLGDIRSRAAHLQGR
ncbi:peptidoglycan recognition protein [Kitasatospora sp. NPDC008050]|uniref:peptidoglycan recognition protein family protein n=1 Tax=Kitasatospora sp. NPDC008050 TaxID=3364021 RepID=UPI0036E99837